MDNIKTKIGRKIRELRLRKKYSQEKLAELAGLHFTYVSSVERGERNISLENIERIAKALEVNIKELFN